MCNELVEVRIAGIPATVQVDSFTKVKPWRGGIMSCPSDLDYYGYTEMEYTICDRNGRPAPWLERKVTAKDTEAIEEAIINAMDDDDGSDYEREY
jgi:hypothetical protein